MDCLINRILFQNIIFFIDSSGAAPVFAAAVMDP